jgi:NAD(P)-dependent dehydrogenase (short-subunit alcohol dehydrogenase family)
MTWAKKAVVVTGGAMGIGRYVALAAAKRGASVAVADIDAEGLSAVEAELRALGGKTLALHVDVGREEDVRTLMDRTASAFGTIDYLVNNAAIVPHFNWGSPRWPRVRDMDFAFWSKVVSTNLHGAWLCSKYAIPFMEKQRSGHITCFHGGGYTTPPGAMAYAVTKDALVTFSRFLAEEVREDNICVIAMALRVAVATERAPDEARRTMASPESVGERYLLAAEAPMELSGQLVDFVDGALVPID